MNRLTFTILALSASLTSQAADGRAIVDFFQDPFQVGFVVALLFLLVALIAINKTLNVIRDIAVAKATADSPAEEGATAKAPVQEERSFMQILTDAKPIEKEADILLDHDYDGIHELDNNLPPWWLWGFYFSIIFAVGYMIRFHIAGGPSSDEEFQQEMAQAQQEVEAYLATASNLIDETNVELLTAQARLDAGKKIFDANCVACHLADGGGLVGPNLTDAYWIHGGSIEKVFSTIKYGVPAKGMISWKDQLSPSQMQEVASYILSLQGTTPANPKAPEGDLWQETTESTEEQTDTDATEATEVTEEVAEVAEL